MRESRITGVYKIQSILYPDRIYIGSTLDFTARVKQHLDLLARGKHYNKRLQSHYNKYGKDDLKFEIIEEHPMCEFSSMRYSITYGLKQKEHRHVSSLQPFFNKNNVMTDWENRTYQRQIYNSKSKSI